MHWKWGKFPKEIVFLISNYEKSFSSFIFLIFIISQKIEKKLKEKENYIIIEEKLKFPIN